MARKASHIREGGETVQVNILDARNNLSRLVTAASNGEEVVIANRGKPVARLVGVDSVESAQTAAGVVDWLRRNPLPAPASRHSEDLDRQIAEEREGWE